MKWINEINIGYLRSLRWWFKKSNHWCVRSPDGTLLGRRICCEECDGIGLESSERTNRHPTRISTAYGTERHQGIHSITGIPLCNYPALAGWDWAGIVALPCGTVLGDKFCPSFLCNIVTAKKIRELTNWRLSHYDAVGLRDGLTAHAYLGTCRHRAKVDAVVDSDSPAS